MAPEDPVPQSGCRGGGIIAASGVMVVAVSALIAKALRAAPVHDRNG